MIRLKKLKIRGNHSGSLPVFYNHIVYNTLIRVDGPEKVSFSERLNCYIDHPEPEKMISKIIDQSKTRPS